MGRSRGLKQSYDFRNAAHDLANQILSAEQGSTDYIADPAERARAICGLTKAFAEADDRVAFHRRRGKPANVAAPTKPKPSRTRYGSSSQPIALPVQPDTLPSQLEPSSPPGPEPCAPPSPLVTDGASTPSAQQGTPPH